MGCKYCGNEMKGRTDKIFCDNQCRSAFHNSMSNNKEEFVRLINKKLRKNRMILKFTSPQGKTTVRREFLGDKGFDFNYFTNIYKTQSGNSYYMCYDYGCMYLPEDKVLIINWQPYMKHPC
ncbi:MAG: hypothetical protein U9R19_13665 [Bacteroidota bacterium]|nr:hypothetical protein [Bacteroidota bacterium]